MPALLFDLGGTYLRCGLTDASEKVLHIKKVRIKNFLDNLAPDDISRGIVAHVADYERSMCAQLSSDDPIVFSFPGPILRRHKILSAPTVFGHRNIFPDFIGEIREKTRRRVHILNDVSAAAWYLSEIHKTNRFFVVTISSGIGSKIFDRNHVECVLDDPPHSGEIGHVTVDFQPDSIRCDCGGKGHLGAIASGRGVERLAHRRARENPDAFRLSACVTRYGATLANLNNEEHIVPAARMGDQWTLSIVRDCTRYLAQVLLTVILAAGIEEVFIIGGFAVALGEVYLTLLRELLIEICSYSIIDARLPNIIQIANFEEEICLQGTAAYARHLRLSRSLPT